MPHILIADDDPPILAVLTEALEGAGWTVTPVDDGAHVLPLLEVRPPDIALLDVAMPPVDGLDVLRTIRERGYTMPVVLFSAKTHPSHEGLMERLVRAAGGTQFVPKPFDVHELLATLTRLVPP